MSLKLHLIQVDGLSGKAFRVARVTFRGVSHFSKLVENVGESAVFDEWFEWPVSRFVKCEEQIEIQLFNHNRYLSNRSVGTFGMVLQQLLESGELSVNDCMLDDNNVVLKLIYEPPADDVTDSSTALRDLSQHAPTGAAVDDTKTGSGCTRRHSEPETLESRHLSPKRLWSTPTTVAIASKSKTAFNKFKRLGKRPSVVNEDPTANLTDGSSPNRPVDGLANTAETDRLMETCENEMQTEISANNLITLSKRNKCLQQVEQVYMKAQDFQVTVTVIEARQLAGANMDPLVCVQVGDQKKFTSVKESTNCPYYNEYFVFDFNMAPAMLFDKIITLTVLHYRTFIRSHRLLGQFKLDVGTIFAQPDHQFYHKWAMLTDPDDINSGPKGYLKCDIAVVGKGDNVKVPQQFNKDDDDIESNLLLPDNVSTERQKARFYLRVYKAEGLPRMTTGLMANVKKAITGESKDLVNPYVVVSFAGHQGRTSIKRGCYEPVWNEQVVFTEMFPPLCRRFKIQLCDNSVNDDVIGTHFIDLSKISNDGEKGFLPTFGPCWINLYGSTRSYSLIEEHAHLNEGLDEGVSFRGRLLVMLTTEILEGPEVGPATVEVETTLPVSDGLVGRPTEFFLFGCILEANMIDRKLGEKPVKFEVSIGNFGNSMDGRNDSNKTQTKSANTSESSDEKEPLIAPSDGGKETLQSSPAEWKSTTEPIQPYSNDRFYYYLHLSEKPCLWIKSSFEDHRRRIHNTNMIEKISEQLEDGLADVNDMIQCDNPVSYRRLREVLDDLSLACSRYVSSTRQVRGRGATAPLAGRTRLDIERLKLCQRELEVIGTKAQSTKHQVNRTNVKSQMKTAMTMLAKLRQISIEPQHTLPDIFIWMIQNNRRVAYSRIPAKDVLYSATKEEMGRNCASVQTIFLKLPGRKGAGPSGWSVQAKLQVYFWLGVSRYKKEMLTGLPEGYENTEALRNCCRGVENPPLSLRYTENQTFQLRAHMYQARGLIGSDESGLSDPFARVVVSEQSQCTQVIEETLSPTWDEMLIFNTITIYGTIESIRKAPPTVVIEIFDQDRVGKAEYIGRTLARPVVKASNEPYEKPNFPPQLEWFDVHRGTDKAGELLAAFEMLQLSFPGETATDDLPPCELPENNSESKERRNVTPVPVGIRPTLSRHRIEVLFWGVRDLKRLHLMSVDRPRIDVECAGNILSSSTIPSYKKNSNFAVPVRYFDLDLPDNEIYCPPITIRCIDCRSFGRDVLVGTHVINNVHKFFYNPRTKSNSESTTNEPTKTVGVDDLQRSTLQVPGVSFMAPNRDRKPSVSSQVSATMMSSQLQQPHMDDILINIDERQPLICRGDDVITIDAGHDVQKMERSSIVKPTPSSSSSGGSKRKKSSPSNVATTEDEESNDYECLDWWTKYHASVDGAVIELKEKADRAEVVNMLDEMDAESARAAVAEKSSSTVPATSGSYKSLGGLVPPAVDPMPLTGGYGAIPNGSVNEQDSKNAADLLTKADQNRWHFGNKHLTLRGLARAVTFAAKLSPKIQRKKEETPTSSIAQLKYFTNELEAQTQFNGFREWLHTFELYRGKKTGDSDDDENRIVGKFKGGIVVYKLPLPQDVDDGLISIGGVLHLYRFPVTETVMAPFTGASATSASMSGGTCDDAVSSSLIFRGLPSNEPVHVLVRIYVVKAIDLHPADINGKADPYIEIRLGQHVISDKENYISKQLNPVFGKCFEVEATFPQDSSLKIRVFDWDLIGSDDLIGETSIDLENRYYSRHRATCGIAQTYDVDGYNEWRDPLTPTQILTKLCRDYRLEGPIYQAGKVRIGNRLFTGPSSESSAYYDPETPNLPSGLEKGNKPRLADEYLALAVLHHWEEIPKVGCKLVPEHVETRPLYNPDKPGIEQGKLEMWVDMFPMDMPAPGPPTKICPRKPKSYELRVIIWNTDDVVLEDDEFFTGEKMSDIYVKGWIKGPEDTQCTDIHYRSLTGEGNFNWRFIFPFDYLLAEEKIVISRKDTVFSWDETETKIPARLNLQVWDADHFSADDFLGALTLDLNRFPRGAKSSKLCTLDMLKTDGSVPQMSLFKHKRVKGWWPFHIKNEGEVLELTGKLEAEMQLLSLEEADKHPAGLGRGEPEALEKPVRPDTSFIWFLNPLKSIRYILWHNYRWLILKVVLFLLLVLLIALFFYSLPGYMVKKMIGA